MGRSSVWAVQPRAGRGAQACAVAARPAHGGRHPVAGCPRCGGRAPAGRWAVFEGRFCPVVSDWAR
eukprot:5752342-Lingulodinium_polyedra.AAC.1